VVETKKRMKELSCEHVNKFVAVAVYCVEESTVLAMLVINITVAFLRCSIFDALV
jgi:hypothetical protein